MHNPAYKDVMLMEYDCDDGDGDVGDDGDDDEDGDVGDDCDDGED